MFYVSVYALDIAPLQFFPLNTLMLCGFGRHYVANIYINNVVVKVTDAHGHDWGAFHKQTSCDRILCFSFLCKKTALHVGVFTSPPRQRVHRE